MVGATQYSKVHGYNLAASLAITLHAHHTPAYDTFMAVVGNSPLATTFHTSDNPCGSPPFPCAACRIFRLLSLVGQLAAPRRTCALPPYAAGTAQYANPRPPHVHVPTACGKVGKGS